MTCIILLSISLFFVSLLSTSCILCRATKRGMTFTRLALLLLFPALALAATTEAGAAAAGAGAAGEQASGFDPKLYWSPRWDGKQWTLEERVRFLLPIVPLVLGDFDRASAPFRFLAPRTCVLSPTVPSFFFLSVCCQENAPLPPTLEAVKDLECKVCRQWISSAIAWLPRNFDLDILQNALQQSCKDTWIIHDPDFVYTEVKPFVKPRDPPFYVRNNQGKCEKMFEKDKAQEALVTIWGMWDELHEVGGLPNAVCCRLAYCPCLEFANEMRGEFWNGPMGVKPPTYIQT